MTRLLVLIGLVGLAVWWVASRLRRRDRDDSPGAGSAARAGAPAKSPPEAAAAPMVACAHCGVHLPRPDAVTDAQGRAYCGDEHRLAGPR